MMNCLMHRNNHQVNESSALMQFVLTVQMSWTEHGGKRGSLQRGNRVDEDEGMEDNSLYSGRESGTCSPVYMSHLSVHLCEDQLLFPHVSETGEAADCAHCHQWSPGIRTVLDSTVSTKGSFRRVQHIPEFISLVMKANSITLVSAQSNSNC